MLGFRRLSVFVKKQSYCELIDVGKEKLDTEECAVEPPSPGEVFPRERNDEKHCTGAHHEE